MDGSQILTLILSLCAASATALITGLLARPKTRAEANATNASGEVAISGDARAWAQTFAERAQASDARAQRAEERAEKAEKHAHDADVKADETADHLDDMESMLIAVANYATALQEEIIKMGGHPPPPPPELVPPLRHVHPRTSPDERNPHN